MTLEIRVSPSVVITTASFRTLFICLLVNLAPVTGSPSFTATVPHSVYRAERATMVMEVF